MNRTTKSGGIKEHYRSGRGWTKINKCSCGRYPINIGNRVSCKCGRSTKSFMTGEYQQEVELALRAWNSGRIDKENK